MDGSTLSRLKAFAQPYYESKDELHGPAHVERILSGARELAAADTVDDDLLIFGAHFHGFVYSDESGVRHFLSSLGTLNERIASIIKVAWESGKSAQPETMEGGYLHDAHLIEGGKCFHVARSLITGAVRGQTLVETMAFLEKRILGKFSCVTPRGQSIYGDIEQFTEDFVRELKNALQ